MHNSSSPNLKPTLNDLRKYSVMQDFLTQKNYENSSLSMKPATSSLPLANENPHTPLSSG